MDTDTGIVGTMVDYARRLLTRLAERDAAELRAIAREDRAAAVRCEQDAQDAERAADDRMARSRALIAWLFGGAE